jgi:putative transposase
MNGFGFRKNTVFEWAGAGFRIERIHANGDILLERLADGTSLIERQDRLLAEYREGNLSAGTPREVAKPRAEVYSRPLDELSNEVQQEAARRKHYLHAIFDQGKPVFTKACLSPLILRAAEDIGDKRPPSVTSIYRWYRQFRTNGDARALIPRFDRRGSKDMKQNARVLQLASDAIEDAFSASPHSTGQSIHTRLVAKINTENQYLPQIDQLKPPSLRTLYRMLNRVEAYERSLLKDGKAATEKKFMLVKHETKTTQILERVEIDHTPLDLFLIDEKSWLPLGRPTLTVAIDHFSRMLLGYHLSFGNPSTAAVMGALRHAILPKPTASEPLNNLTTEHAWPCYGVPDLIVVDNGLEFHSKDLDSVALDLGLSIHYCPKYQPRFKGTVERYLKTINYFFAHQLPGTSLARWHLRGDYDPQKHAVLTLAEFNQIFQKWALDIYSQEVHRGIRETPWARWHAGLQQRTPELPQSINILRQRIGQVDERTLRHDGITLHGIRYNGDALSPILNSHGPGTKVRVLFDSEDLGSIQVWGPDSAEPVCVRALNQGYANELTSLQNEMIRTALREKATSQTNPAALQQAKQDIIGAVERLMGSRKQRDRRRAAAVRGMSSSKPEAASMAPHCRDQSQPKPITTKTERNRSLPSEEHSDRDTPPPVKYAFFRPKQEASIGENS